MTSDDGAEGRGECVGPDSSGDDPALTAAALLIPTAAALRGCTLEVSEYIERTLARLECVDRVIRAFVPEAGRAGRLRREAVSLIGRYPDPGRRPPLFGIAVGVKDLFRVDGRPTRAGSGLPADVLAGPEASLVTAVRAAGALVLGKTAMDEFAYCEPALTRNPHNVAHTPGGSSSGSAAAVAAGMCSLAIGTQTSRSVIGPAAFCGVVGFKPTFGRVPLDGTISLAPSLDTVGFFTQDAAGMDAAAAALVPNWTPAARTRPPVLGVPEGKLMTWTSPEGRLAYEGHVARLDSAGYEVRRVQFFTDEEIEEMDRCTMLLLHGEMARIHAEWFARYLDRYRPRTARAIRRGQTVTNGELGTCRAYQEQFRQRVAALMDEAGIDLWVTPASAGPAPAGLDVTGWGGMTTPWSYAGMPCVTVPAGRAANGLPLGIQCVATRHNDEGLLAWAAGIAAVFADDLPRSADSASARFADW